MTEAAPPLPPAPLPAQGQNSAPTPTPAPAPAVVGAPVQSAPPSLQAPPRPVRIPGRIVASAPVEQAIRIAAAEGEIKIKSSVPLPPDAEVTVELYMEKAKTLANIIVLKKQAAMTEELAQVIVSKAPPPQLKAGDVVTALQLPGDVPAPAPAQNAADKAVQLVAQMKPAEVQAFAAKLGVPPDIVRQALKAPDPAAAFRALPAPLQEKIFSLLSIPDAPEAPALPAAPARAAPAPQPGEASEALDNNLLHIIRAQLGAKIVQQAVQAQPAPASAPPAPPLAGGLGALLSAIEQMKPPGMSTLPFLRGVVAAKAEQVAELLPKNMFEFKIMSIAPPVQKDGPAPAEKTQIPPAHVPAAGAMVFEGEVESVTPGGHPVIRRADGAHFVLKEPVSVTTGSIILFEARPLTPRQAVSGIAARAGEGLDLFGSTTWPALEEALRAAAPEMTQALHRAVPAPARGMTPAALLFLAALRMGEIGNWLGTDNLQALRKAGRGDLAARLAGDFGKISEQAKEALPGGWRMISMPLLHDEALSRIHFFYRRQDGQEREEGDGGGKPATRFLVNLSLSRMGEMQLDGFLRQKQLDLVLRTRGPLPAGMRREIMERFAAGLEQTGMQGGMSFQAKMQGWVTVETAGRGATLA